MTGVSDIADNKDVSTAGGGGASGGGGGIRIIDLADKSIVFNNNNNNNKIGAPSKFVACDGNTVQFSLTAGDDVVLNCNNKDGKESLIVKRINNNSPISIAYSSKDGLTHADALVVSPGELVFDPNTSEITSASTNSIISIRTDKGNIVDLHPGETVQLSKAMVNTKIL